MLPLALNWSFDPLNLQTYPLWVFFDIMGEPDEDFIFIPFTDDEIHTLIHGMRSDEELEPHRKQIELSMLARSDPEFKPNFLDKDKDYTAETILSMEFPIDRDEMSEQQFYATKMSMEVRKARGWNAAIVFKLMVPLEQFVFLTGKFPYDFGRGSITEWDAKKLGFPLGWNNFGTPETLSFGKLIYGALAAVVREREKEDA